MSLSAYRHSAAEIAAAAIYESFPDVELLGGCETSLGFSYDLVFPHSVHGETLPMIEQAMRQISRERREIRILEMVPFSARELLKSQGHLSRAAALERETDQFVQVVQIGSFYDLTRGEQLKNSNQLFAFKLHSFHTLSDGTKRLKGYAYPTKEELNEFLKKLKSYPQRRHEAQGESQLLWKRIGSELVWLEKGLKLRQRLIRFFEEKIFDGVEQISASPGVNRMELVRELQKPVGETVISPSYKILDLDAGLYGIDGTQIHIFCLDSISLLQTIEKSLNILGLEYKREFSVEDLLGREWPVVSFRKMSGGVAASVAIDKILALLLEKYERLERLAFENQ